MKKTHAVILTLAVIAAFVTALPVSALWYPADAKLNSSPVAENLELTTYRSVPVEGTFKSLDPEGDPVVYAVLDAPRKGAVETDGETFIYTPADGKKGKDTFTYTASDDKGNVSNAATVTVNIKKQKTSVTYSDVSAADAYPATLLAEKGIFVGESMGGQYLFRPADTVSRGEFLVMCMSVTGAELMDVKSTGFFDDGSIPVWQKPYVTTAVMGDLITGSPLDGHLVFSPDEPITFAQASVLLNNALGITDVYLDGSEPAAPAWAYQASSNLASCDMLPDVAQGVSAAPVTRSDAARLLARAMELMERRNTDPLTGWLK